MFKDPLIVIAVSIFLTSGALNVAYASNSSKVVSENGFKNINAPSTSTMLNSTSESVFEVRILSEDSVDKINVFNLTDPKLQGFEQKISSGAGLSPQELISINKQVERCRRDKIEKECPVLFTIEKATAFLAGGDGSFLITNAHVVNRYLKLRAAIEGKTILDLLKTPQRIPIFLFNSQGSLVFDPYIAPAYITTYGNPSILALRNFSWYAEDSDYVVIKLPAPIGNPLKIARTMSVGEAVFRLGYAACTGCAENPNKTNPELNRDRGSAGNSNGTDLYWTSGKIQSLETASEFLKLPLGYLEGTHKDNFIFFNADSQVGMSGGPIVNQSGEVVGVFSGSKPKINDDGSMVVMSRGVRPPEFDKIK